MSGEEIKENQSDKARTVELEDREYSSTLGYLIQTFNVTKAKPCENVMKLRNKKKRENTIHEFWILNKETFTLLIFSATREMGRECSMFVKKISQLISIKRKEELSGITYRIRCKISFALLWNCLLCIQVSRKPIDAYEKLNEIFFNATTIVKRNDKDVLITKHLWS